MHRFHLPVSVAFSQFLKLIIPNLDFGTLQVTVTYLRRVTDFFLGSFPRQHLFLKFLSRKELLAGAFTLFKAIHICFDICQRIKKPSQKGNFAVVAAGQSWGQEGTEEDNRRILFWFLLCMSPESFTLLQQGTG